MDRGWIVDLDRVAREQHRAEGVVEPKGEGARGGVLGDRCPAYDLQVGQRRADLVAELAGVATIEEAALQPARRA